MRVLSRLRLSATAEQRRRCLDRAAPVVVPAAPAFIKCDALAIDESFPWRRCCTEPTTKPSLIVDLAYSWATGRSPDDTDLTADLIAFPRARMPCSRRSRKGGCPARAIARKVYRLPMSQQATRLEWRRKLRARSLSRHAGQGIQGCVRKVAMHNQLVAKLARFWRSAWNGRSKRRTSARPGWSCDTA